MTRLAVAALLGALAVTPAIAADACPFSSAVYREPETGITLAMRPHALPADPPGMVSLMFDVSAPPDAAPGRDWQLGGMITTNMGISRDEGTAFADCPVDGEGGYVSVTSDCTVWTGVIYALGDDTARLLPFPDEPAPAALLLADFGRQLRYNGPLVDPGEAPWDVFVLERCAAP
jgi:hypothetical protein